MTLLSPGDIFPTLTLQVGHGGSITLPDEFAGRFAVVLVYRGAWCPYCNAQLASFNRSLAKLDEAGIEVAALSIDDQVTTAGLVAKHYLEFTVAHSADAAKVAEATGAFVDPKDGYLQSTGFVLAPDGTVVVSVYSSGAIGRLVPADVLGLVDHVRAHAS